MSRFSRAGALTVGAGASAVAIALGATAAGAGTVTAPGGLPTKPPPAEANLYVQGGCYVSPGPSKRVPIIVTGTDWNAGANVSLRYGDVKTHVRANLEGRIHKRVPGYALGRKQRIKSFILTASDSAGQVERSLPFQVTYTQVWVGPQRKHPTTTQTFTYHFLGFRADRHIYEHYFYHGKYVTTRSLGYTTSPCTVNVGRATFFPVRYGVKPGKYVLQYDSQARWARNTLPRLVGTQKVKHRPGDPDTWPK